MTYLEGDVVQPVELVVPTKESAYIGKQGDLFLSGNKLWVNVGGGDVQVVTSA